MTVRTWSVCLGLGFAALGGGLTGCEDKPAPALAPTAETLAPKAAAPANAHRFTVDKEQSSVDFTMEAPLEQIRGEVHQTLTGEVHVDLSDVTKTKAHLVLNLESLLLKQRVRAKEGGELGEETPHPEQNKHARAWLEIGDDAPPKQRAKYLRVEFAINSVKAAVKDITKMTGDTRTVKATVTGDFLLHGRVKERTAEVEITFTMKGGKPDSVHIKTVKPFSVGLEEHDVRPRKGFGVLAAKTLEVLAPKVAKAAEVSIDVTAKASGNSGGTYDVKAGAAGSAAAARTPETAPYGSGPAK